MSDRLTTRGFSRARVIEKMSISSRFSRMKEGLRVDCAHSLGLLFGVFAVVFGTCVFGAEPFEDITVPLWSQGAPGALGSESKDIPKLTVRRVVSDAPTGALIICPGGGYGGLAMDHEGTQMVEWANTLGLTAVLCDYRHRGKGYGHPAPLQDAQRAVRMVRAMSNEWNPENVINKLLEKQQFYIINSVLTNKVLDSD